MPVFFFGHGQDPPEVRIDFPGDIVWMPLSPDLEFTIPDIDDPGTLAPDEWNWGETCTDGVAFKFASDTDDVMRIDENPAPPKGPSEPGPKK